MPPVHICTSLIFARSDDDGASWDQLEVLLDPNELFDDCNQTEAARCTDGVGPGGRWDSPGCQTGVGVVCGGGCAVWDPTPVADADTGHVHVLFGRSTSSCRGGHPPGCGKTCGS